MYNRQNDGHTTSLELSDSFGNAYQFGTLLMGPTLIVVCSLPIKNMFHNKVESNHLLGGVCVLKNKDIGANNHYFIHGHYFQFFFHMLPLYNILLWVNRKGVALLIIPNYLLFHML